MGWAGMTAPGTGGVRPVAYEDLFDPSNPFHTQGLSREDRNLLAYLQAARRATGADIVVTSTTDHPPYTSSGNPSRHVAPGTEGKGLALDARTRTRGTYRDAHRAVFDAFARVEGQLHELIYAYAPYNIKAGRRVPPYAVSDHRDHVHVSVDRGVFVLYPAPVVPPPAATPFRLENRVFTFLQVTLDATGAGWRDWNPGFDPVAFGVTRQGPNPAGMTKAGQNTAPRDGFWYESAQGPNGELREKSSPTISAQVADGLVIVSVEGGKPGGTCGVYAWAAPAA